jgi:hypothetical protein
MGCDEMGRLEAAAQYAAEGAKHAAGRPPDFYGATGKLPNESLRHSKRSPKVYQDFEQSQEAKVANICENTIAVVGLKEDPENFVGKLSRAMFHIDLENLDPKQWGEGPEIDGKTWYRSLVDGYRREGVHAARYGILYPQDAYNRLGVTAPRFYCETKWEPPIDQISKASRAFPEMTFHLAWWVLQDGPTGELAIRNGELLESIKRKGSWYLFDPYASEQAQG